MNADSVLATTFAAHENLAPDADQTLAAINAEIHGRRRRIATRSAGAASALLVAAIAISAALAGQRATSGPVTSPPAASGPSSAPARPTPLPAPDYVTVAAGWLPAGSATEVVAFNGFGSEGRGYDLSGGGKSTYLLIGLDEGTALPTEYKRGTARNLTITGQPAREWSVDGWYHLVIKRADGHIASVEIERDPAAGSAAELAGIGRQVGSGLQFGRHDRLKPAFALSDLPAGLAIRSVTADTSSGTIYTLASPSATDRSLPYASITMASTLDQTDTGKPAPVAVPGRPVQGHQTKLLAGGDYPSLQILDAADGRSIFLTGGPGLSTEADLYRVADGLILAG